MTVLALVVGAGFAGCVEPAIECESGTCDVLGALVPEWGVQDAVQFQDCAGAYGLINAPESRIRELVPKEFLLAGWTWGTTLLILEAFSCERVVANATVHNQVRLVRLLVFVVPDNESWAPESTQFYTLDLLASSAPLATELMDVAPSREAQVSVTPTATGSRAWTVEAEDCGLAFETPPAGEARGASARASAQWTGPRPFALVQEQMSWSSMGSLYGGIVRTEGTCGSALALGPASPITLEPQTMSAAWTISNQTFG